MRYDVEYYYLPVNRRETILEQLNFHGLQKTAFYSWVSIDSVGSPAGNTVAIWRIKWK